jgi:pimeloyl-ACP methyl ester carboxylesterase
MSGSSREARPPLVFLPGLLCDATLFDSQIERLAERWRILTPSIGAATSLDALADSVLDRLPDRSVLIGLSMGGRIALSICSRHPERCLALALIATSARPEEGARRDRRLKAANFLERLGGARRAEDYLPLLLSGYAFTAPAMRETVYEMATRIPVGDVIAQIRAVSNRPDFREALPRLDLPALVMCGADDTDTPVELHREMADLLPRATLSVIPDCGHLPPLEQPEIVDGLLESWLEEIDWAADARRDATQ